MTSKFDRRTRSWPCGRYTCTLTLPTAKPGQPAHCSIEWSPTVPTQLTKVELAQYRAGRDSALLELARIIGGTVAVVEV